MKSNQMAIMKIPSKMKTSATVANKMKSSFKKHKKLPVKNSNMQIAEIDFLRVMNSYAENNEEKRYENENFCRLNCCRIEKVK